MAGATLYDKLWQSHLVREEADGTAMIYIDRHLVHEVTSPQAYEGLKLAGRKVWRPDSVVATADHNTPTRNWDKGLDGITDLVSRLQVETLDKNIREFKAKVYFPFLDKRQGIVHVIGPENGATLPGMTVVCGDSHTSTHGAFAALAFGIGTSEVEHVLATQCMVMKKSKAMQIVVDGITFKLMPYKEGMIWNETLELLYIEKADLKGQSGEDKVVTMYKAAKDFKIKAQPISLEEGLAQTIEVKKEAAVGPV